MIYCKRCDFTHLLIAESFTLKSKSRSLEKQIYVIEREKTEQFHLVAMSSTAKTMYRKFKINIPINETAQPRSQFPHACICERFIYSQDRSACNKIGRPILAIHKSLTDT